MLKEKLAQHFRNSVAQHGVVPEMPHSSPKVTQHNSLSSLSDFLANSSQTLPAVTTITNSGHSRLTSSTSSIDSTTDSEASFESSFFSNNDLRLSNNTPLRQSSGGNPQLVLLRQTSLTEEKVAKNGEQKNVHVIVKNIPFVIQLGFNSKSLGDRVLDFNNVAVEAQLHYDCPERKKVDFVKHKPIEYKAHINERGDTISIEMRIKVLTSQLEDMFFRLRLTGVDSMTKEEIVGLLPVFTEPIKVVSKPDQVNRIKEKNAQPVVAEPVLRRKKRTASDSFQDTLDQIVKQQAQQQAMLQKLLERDQLLFGDASPCPPGSQSLCAANMDQVSPADQFEAAFDSLVAAYNNLDAEMRPKKIRKLVNKVSARDTDTLGAMIDQFQYELSRDSPAESTNSASSFEFTNDKGEIEKLDYFYKEFLSLPDPSPPTY